ncbi:hypothetical protein [Chitinophaga vietnamensis]|uniref:hypothetical protein n=1 Tax=Chitinophaga vietnamensis TaxID=2593957 RepID=UPI0011787983|nr:hypothetical protein [Chitinophaga vietnamensis]
MKKLALIAAATGIFVALAAFAASETGIIGIKTFFELGFAGLGLMILSSVYFLFSCIHEWARSLSGSGL